MLGRRWRRHDDDRYRRASEIDHDLVALDVVDVQIAAEQQAECSADLVLEAVRLKHSAEADHEVDRAVRVVGDENTNDLPGGTAGAQQFVSDGCGRTAEE